MKQANKIEPKGMVVREVVSADRVDRETGESSKVLNCGSSKVAAPYDPGEITAAWGMAVKGLYNQVAFGAMLCELETNLTRENGAKKTDSGYCSGLQGWLAMNCPVVNYKTAMRFKRMAEAAMELALPEGSGRIGAGEVPVLLRILPPAGVSFGSDETRKREALESFLVGKSQRDVFAALRGPGRPKGTPSAGRRALTAAEKTDHAWTEIRELLGKVAAYTQGPWIEMLPEDRREWAARTMKDLATCFRDGRPFEAGTPNAERRTADANGY